jgi:hypothetical protein
MQTVPLITQKFIIQKRHGSDQCCNEYIFANCNTEKDTKSKDYLFDAKNSVMTWVLNVHAAQDILSFLKI